MEKDKSSHKRGKLPSIKTELLLSWVKVGASSQLDPFKHQQESNPVPKEGAELRFLLQHPYKDLGIQQVLSLTQLWTLTWKIQHYPDPTFCSFSLPACLSQMSHRAVASQPPLIHGYQPLRKLRETSLLFHYFWTSLFHH